MSEKAVLADKGVQLLIGEINNQSCEKVVQFILEKNFENFDDIKHLTLIVNSTGGDISAAFAIIDIMRGSKIPIHTVGLGLIASCGLLIFIAGESGHRVLTPNTSILSHQWSWGRYGKEHELVAATKEFDLTTERMIEHYKKCTGLDKKTVEEKLLPPHDVWLSAKEAKKYNICDKIKLLR